MSIEDIRHKIDDIDGRLARLLEERLSLAAAIGEEKRKLDLPVCDSLREQAILDRIAAEHPARAAEIAEIYHAIFEAAKSLQK